MRRAVALIELIFAIVVMAIALLSLPNLVSSNIKASKGILEQEAVSQGSSFIHSILTLAWDEADTNESYPGPVLEVESATASSSSSGSSGSSHDHDSGDSHSGGWGFSIPNPFKEWIEWGFKTGRRVGVPIFADRVFISLEPGKPRLSATPPTQLGGDADDMGEFDDIDDYNNYQTTLHLFSSSAVSVATGDYIDTNVTIKSKVSYVDDLPNTSDNSFNHSVIIFNNPFDSSKEKSISTNIKKVTVQITSNKNALDKNVVYNAFSCNIGTANLKGRDFDN
ncbi:MAG: hypothetical protein GXO02_00045 [Epsilonproteobacteria bacterium]|nr:hypothetical protein [Campylobacterota bacterium]